MNRRDTAAALGCLLIGGLLTVESLRLDQGDLARPGPGFMPLALGAGLLALSAVYLASALAHRMIPGPEWTAARWRGPLLAAAAVTAYGVALVPAGFAPATAAFVLFWLAVIERRRPQTGIVYAVLATTGLYLVFAWGLRLRLPLGPLFG
ncbi:MAG TPA: tripartite tricarboxylate transporter TctB family protein [Desulfobacterales bacterium]|nr:tripartite tricarboxylate transporter TctB family protein [Desulfobacterales bacterium]